MIETSRRQFLQLTLTGLAVSGASALGMGALAGANGADTTSWFSDFEPARKLGRTYLKGKRSREDRTSVDALGKKLFGSKSAPVAERPSPELLKWLADTIRADFVSDRIVDVKGWQLSRTEVELCALFALETSQAATAH